MQTVHVSLADRPYPILIAPNLIDNADALAPFVKGQAPAEPKRLADYRLPTKGKSGPWTFTLPYDKAAIDQTKLYGVQAKIMLGDEVLFKSAKASMVLTGGKDDKTNVTLLPAN